MTEPTAAPMNGPTTNFPPAATYRQPSPPMMYMQPTPPQRHGLAAPFKDGFFVGLGFIVASFVPLGVIIVLVVTLAGIGSQR